MAEELRVSGGAAPSEAVFKRIAQPLAQATGITLKLSSAGPVQAWKDLDAGAVDAAAAGITFQEWAALMESEGYKVEKGNYMAQIIGMDSIKIFTNKDVAIQRLDKEQVKGIFTGEITNWSQVGGPDMPIVVVLGTKIAGTLAEFKKKILGDAEYLKDAIQVETAADIKQKIIATSGAIGIGSKGQVDDSVNVPRYPEPTRIITLITKVGERQDTVKTMVQFIMGEGKQYL
ncbi:MAG: substrate-binding domain-containing protein [bacterium]|nr:substrate-binding domain-containing protein [bacterium]